jgi:hypothetical protein
MYIQGGKYINTGKIALPTINSSASPHNSKKNRANYLNGMNNDANRYNYVYMFINIYVHVYKYAYFYIYLMYIRVYIYMYI